jgi:hypothetical protein
MSITDSGTGRVKARASLLHPPLRSGEGDRRSRWRGRAHAPAFTDEICETGPCGRAPSLTPVQNPFMIMSDCHSRHGSETVPPPGCHPCAKQASIRQPAQMVRQIPAFAGLTARDGQTNPRHPRPCDSPPRRHTHRGPNHGNREKHPCTERTARNRSNRNRAVQPVDQVEVGVLQHQRRHSDGAVMHQEREVVLRIERLGRLGDGDEELPRIVAGVVRHR